jgi:two-component system nitrate/nitrite response regulator NarL
VEVIASSKPDLVLIDLRLSQENGLDIVEEANKRKERCKCVILTSFADPEDFRRAEASGVHGFILKEALPEEILYAIRIIGRGRKYYDPNVVRLMVEDNGGGFTEELTPREWDVLKALGRGLANRQIAKELYITEYTVKKHVSQILAKLGLKDRTQAALYANARGVARYQ